MGFLALSFSHKSVDIATREMLHFGADEATAALGKIASSPKILESMLLSTCNRLEIYVYADDEAAARAHILGVIEERKNIKDLGDFVVVKSGEQAIAHIFSVASSLESLVVGETQITGQLKAAFNAAHAAKHAGAQFLRLINAAVKCAAAVRNTLDIGSSSTSVAGAAVAMAKERLKRAGRSIKDATAIVIGTGEMGVLALKHLLREGARVTLVNRNIEKAREVVETLSQEHVGKRAQKSAISIEPYANLQSLIDNATLLFSATGAPHTIITRDMMRVTQSPRVWFDLALPRDIEDVQSCRQSHYGSCGRSCCENLEIFVIDDLKEIVEKNMSKRASNAADAGKIIDAQVSEFLKNLEALGAEPIIKKIRELAKNASHKELEKALKKGYITPENYKSIEKILHNAFNTFLHAPTLFLKTSLTPEHAQSVNALFALDAELE